MVKYYANYSPWTQNEFEELLEKNSVRRKTNISTKETEAFLKEIGSPHEKLQCIHVAGTNGKGSVVSYITQCLLESGKRVGTFISPHVCDYRERFLIDMKLREGDIFIDEFRRFLEYKPNNLTKFELMTAFMFYYFEREKTDFAVVECGMGGRLDATNVCSPLLSIITGIDYDHTEYLGNTLREIALEKLGIVKEGIPLIMNSRVSECRQEAERVCREKNSRLFFVDFDFSVAEHDLNRLEAELTFYDGEKVMLKSSMVGSYQIENMATSYLALKNYAKERDIRNGFEKAFIPLRFQVEKIGNKTLIFDAAHNPQGIEALNATLKKLLGKENIQVVFNCKHNKDLRKMLETIKCFADEITVPSFSVGYGQEELSKIAREVGIKKVSFCKDIVEAYKSILSNSNNYLVLTGSIYMLGDLFLWLLQKNLRPM